MPDRDVTGSCAPASTLDARDGGNDRPEAGESVLAVEDRGHTMSCGNHRGPAASIKQVVDGFVRQVHMQPGYDCMNFHGDEAGRKCHGRHGMEIRFFLIGEEGAVVFAMYASDWLPGSIEYGHTSRSTPLFGAMAADLGHHWLRPVYEGETENGPCDFLHGAECFYDGSGLNAEPVMVRFFDHGMDAVWEDLEDYYRSCSKGAREAAANASTMRDES